MTSATAIRVSLIVPAPPVPYSRAAPVRITSGRGARRPRQRGPQRRAQAGRGVRGEDRREAELGGLLEAALGVRDRAQLAGQPDLAEARQRLGPLGAERGAARGARD